MNALVRIQRAVPLLIRESASVVPAMREWLMCSITNPGISGYVGPA